MATTSTITALVALSAASRQQDDVLPIVDVHDFTQAPSGSTKKITVANLFTNVIGTGTMSWAGAVTLSSTLGVTGAVTAASFSGVGTSLTALNATNLTSGTVNTARIAGSYTGITAVGTLTSLTLSGGLTGATTGAFSSNVTVGGTFGVTGVSTFGGIGSALVPSSTATYDLGSSSVRWNSLYLAAGISAAGSIAAGTGISIAAGGLSIAAGGLSVTGTTTLNSGATITGAVTGVTTLNASGQINTTGSLVAGTTLNVSGTSTLAAVTATTITASGLSTLNKIKGGSSTPSVSTGVAGASVSVVGNDVCGVVTFTTGVGGFTGAAPLFTLTFSSAYPSPVVPSVTPETVLSMYVPSSAQPTATAFTIGCGSNIGGSATTNFYYQVLGR